MYRRLKLGEKAKKNNILLVARDLMSSLKASLSPWKAGWDPLDQEIEYLRETVEQALKDPAGAESYMKSEFALPEVLA